MNATRLAGDNVVMRAVGAVVIVIVGLLLSALLAAAAGLSGFSCSGGAMGEGCSGGSVLAAVVVFVFSAAAVFWLAWQVGSGGHTGEEREGRPKPSLDDPWADMRPRQ